jgi:flap endonuclease GEN
VDLSCWLVQMYSANRSPAFAKDKVYLKNLFHRIRALLALNCTLLFVTDGAIPSLKLATYRRRLGSISHVSATHSLLLHCKQPFA